MKNKSQGFMGRAALSHLIKSRNCSNVIPRGRELMARLKWSWGSEKANCFFAPDSRARCIFVAFASSLEPTCKVHRYKVFSHVRSVFGWSKSYILILASNPEKGQPAFMVNFFMTKRGPYKRARVYFLCLDTCLIK